MREKHGLSERQRWRERVGKRDSQTDRQRKIWTGSVGNFVIVDIVIVFFRVSASETADGALV